MKFRKKKDVLINIVFYKFQGDSWFLDKIPGYFQGSRSQNKFQAFQGFQGAVGTPWLYISVCPSPTVPNLLQNMDECKKFEIRAHSSLSKGQMHKIIFFFS